MAHADYDCCAVCDSKIDYNTNADSKAIICEDCIKQLKLNNIICDSVKDFNQWLLEVEIGKGKKILKDIGFSICCYGNETDRIYKKRFLEENYEKTSS